MTNNANAVAIPRGFTPKNESSATPTTTTTTVDDNGSTKLMNFPFGWVLCAVYNQLFEQVKFKYEGRDGGPLETHSFLMHTSFATFLIAGLSAGIIVFDYIVLPFPPRIYMALKMLMFLSGIVANLTLIVLLIID
ncbi:hypothetical protein Tco_0149805 [Tanacetum coccineum]